MFFDERSTAQDFLVCVLTANSHGKSDSEHSCDNACVDKNKGK